MKRPLPEDPITAVEAELLQQKAATLARISGTLSGLIEEARRRHSQLRHLPPDDLERARAAYLEVRAKAERYLWYLMVQREALGLYRHERLEELYPIPPQPPED